MNGEMKGMASGARLSARLGFYGKTNRATTFYRMYGIY